VETLLMVSINAARQLGMMKEKWLGKFEQGGKWKDLLI